MNIPAISQATRKAEAKDAAFASRRAISYVQFVKNGIERVHREWEPAWGQTATATFAVY